MKTNRKKYIFNFDCKSLAIKEKKLNQHLKKLIKETPNISTLHEKNSEAIYTSRTQFTI